MTDSSDSTIEIFLAAYREWDTIEVCLKNEVGCAEGRDVLMCAVMNKTTQLPRVRLQDLTKESMNNKEGTILEYVASSDRFCVSVDGNVFGIRAKNLSLQTNEKVDDYSQMSFQTMLSHEGMALEGTIRIPGDAGVADIEEQNKVQPYSLNVVGIDENWGEFVSGAQLIGRHFAYGDEQFIHIKFGLNHEGAPTIEYADGETLCEGVWDETMKEVRGVVRQMTNSEDNVMMPCDKHTHSFSLKPSRPQLSPLRTLVYNARRECLRKFYVLATLDSNWSCLADKREELASVRWLELLEGAQLNNERLCNWFRCAVEVLDGMSFESIAHRVEVLERVSISPFNCSLKTAHNKWDQSLGLITQLIKVIPKIGPHPPINERTLFVFFYTAQNRLLQNFAKFEAALKSASCRLTTQTLALYEKPPPREEQPNLGEQNCAICITLLGTDVELSRDNALERPLYLPCSHAFHATCIKAWLQNNASCPSCRLELEEEGI